ncbi:hypothetical protein [Myroides fluvii]|uniref:hypothetical protein n=1 Tax=Myroides fluvii TaxID=2572594 RepID=UPI00131E6B79|nr:hypothetical protein [Myroides fluvii]
MTTKIQFKLSNDVLLTVIQMVEKTDDYVVQSIKDALLVSIKEDLLAKLEDKAKNIQKQVSILDHNKKHAIVLKYHEAYTMYKLLELVYEKETFADHPHIKKVKRLLVDLENKVESFTTENKETDETQTTAAALANFPRLGVNEIIIEEATILEGELSEEVQADLQEEDNNPVLDPTIDVNEIIVKNYSIFDLLEESQPTDAHKEETESKEIEIDAASVTLVEPAIQEEAVAEEVEPQQEEVLESLTTTIEENTTEEPLVFTAEIETTETTTAEVIEETEVNESFTEETFIPQEETTIPSWAQQTTPPIFDGVVTKSSICVESEEEGATACTPTEPEEDTLNLFEDTVLPIQPQEEKVEKTEKEGKKEKKKPAKDHTQQGQISLF